MTAPTPKYYFEDLKLGMVIEAQGPTISEAEIIEFASRYDPQYFHIDPEAARSSPYDGLIASGFQTASLTMRLICDAYLSQAASLGSPGVNELRWLVPVRPGDSLRMRMTVLDAKPSRSKPDRGTVLHLWEVFNQSDTLVMRMEGYGMFWRRQ